MVDLRKKVALIQKYLKDDFGGSYVAELVGDKLRVGSPVGGIITATLINYVCDLDTEFISCCLDGDCIWALFDLD